MNTRVIETRKGVQLRVLEGGPEEAPPVLFLHGIAGLGYVGIEGVAIAGRQGDV